MSNWRCQRFTQPVVAFLLSSTCVYAQSIQNFDDFASLQPLSSFQVGNIGVSLSSPGLILTTGDSLNLLATAPSPLNVLQFFGPDRVVMEFSEPVRRVGFTSGTALSPYSVNTQRVKNTNIDVAARALADLIVDGLVNDAIEAEDLKARFPDLSDSVIADIKTSAGGAVSQVVTLTSQITSEIIRQPNKIAEIAGIDDPDFRGVTADLQSIIFNHGSDSLPVSFPAINQTVDLGNKTSTVFGINRLVFNSSNSEIVIDNFILTPLPTGVREVGLALDFSRDVVQSSGYKNALQATDLAALGFSAAGLATFKLFGIGAPLLALQAATLKTTSAVKKVGTALTLSEVIDPFWTPFEQLAARTDPFELRIPEAEALPLDLQNAFNSYFDHSLVVSDVARTLNETMIRYATAGTQGDLRATIDQVNYAGDLLSELVVAMSQTAAASDILAELLRDDAENNLVVDRTSIEAFIEQLDQGGLPEFEIEILMDLGVSPLEIGRIVEDLKETAISMLELMDDGQTMTTAALFEGMGNAFQQLSDDFATITIDPITLSPLSIAVDNDSGQTIDDLVLKLIDWDGYETYLFPELTLGGRSTFTLSGRNAVNFHSFALFSQDRPLFGLNPFDERIGELSFEQIFGLGAREWFDEDPISFILGNLNVLGLSMPDLTRVGTTVALRLWDFSDRDGTPMLVGSGTGASVIPLPPSAILLLSAVAGLALKARRGNRPSGRA